MVEGDTLADRLNRGPIPVEDSLKMALQIADALKAAHDKGVIHRDLKPLNIKVTDDDKVKVLDFGLAKAFAGDEAEATVSNSPTLSMAATQQGVILGTAAYMSPEQAKGRTVDKRTDVWAFGCVLFEMLTGGQSFGASDVTESLAAVIRSEPEWDTLPANLHPRLREAVERCLEKPVAERFQDIGDVRVDIKKVLADPSGVMAHPVAEVLHRTPSSKLPWVAAVLFGVIAGMAGWNLRPPPEPGQVIRFPFVLPEAQQFSSPAGNVVSLSANGSRLVYLANGQLHLLNLSEMASRPIRGADEPLATQPVLSPDGESVVYFNRDMRAVRRIPVIGGTAVTVWEEGDIGGNPRTMSWTANDDTLLFSQPDGIVQIPSNGGTPEVLVAAQDDEEFGSPQILPGGDWVLSSVKLGDGTWDEAQIAVHNLDSNERKVILEGGSAPRYLPSGHIVYAQANSLFAFPFDLESLERTGGSVSIVEGVQRSSNGIWDTANYLVSDNGTLAYVVGGTQAAIIQRSLVTVDLEGNAIPLTDELRDYFRLRLSPDGSRVAAEVSTAGGAVSPLTFGLLILRTGWEGN